MIRHTRQTGSTQADLLAALAADDPADWPHLSGIWADRQDSGRGRLDRTWDTGSLRALTVSLVLRPGSDPATWAGIGLLVGVAAVRALAGFGVPAQLKWPNDLVVNAHHDVPEWAGIAKIGGILGSVAADSAGDLTCVVGIGINLAGQAPVPWAGTVTDVAAGGVPPEPGALLEAIVSELGPLLGELDRVGELAGACCHTLGKRVTVTRPGPTGPESLAGIAVAIDPDGALVVDSETGTHRILTGEIAHTRIARG